jgi:hypothetical protein
MQDQDPDPTGGFVDFAPFDTANSTGLVSNDTGLIYLGVDSTNVYPAGGQGRPSVRLESKMTFTEGLFIIDLTHMPVGCGTWPGKLIIVSSGQKKSRSLI